MRLLYLTDTHLRASTPANRRDNLVETLRAKLAEVVCLAEEYTVSAVIHGGDLFESPNPGLATAGELLRGFLARLARRGIPFYIAPGNHEMFGHNPATLYRTLLGFMGQIGVIRLLDRTPQYLDDGNVRVQLTGAPFHMDMDRRERAQDYAVKKVGCDVAIHVVHGMLCDRVLFPGAAYTLVDEIKDLTEADFTLAGHNHLGFPEVCHHGRWFINPGALVRLSNHPREMSRLPAVLLLDLDGSPSFRVITLKCARPGEEVLDRSVVEQEAFREARRASFLAAVRAAARTQRTDPAGILEEILQNQNDLDPRVKEEVRRRFGEVLADQATLKGT